MTITTLNFDDIIRAEKRKLVEAGQRPDDYYILWGDEGIEAFRAFNYLPKDSLRPVTKFNMLNHFLPGAEGHRVLHV